MVVYVCSKCGKEGNNNSNMHKHIRTRLCAGATVIVRDRKRPLRLRKPAVAPRAGSGQEEQEQSHIDRGQQQMEKLVQSSAELFAIQNFEDLPVAMLRVTGDVALQHQPVKRNGSFFVGDQSVDQFAKMFVGQALEKFIELAVGLRAEEALQRVKSPMHAVANRTFSIEDGVKMYVSDPKNVHMQLPRSLYSIITAAKKKVKEYVLSL